jgi:hypothetical protein
MAISNRRGSEAAVRYQQQMYNQAMRNLGRNMHNDWGNVREPDWRGYMNAMGGNPFTGAGRPRVAATAQAAPVMPQLPSLPFGGGGVAASGGGGSAPSMGEQMAALLGGMGGGMGMGAMGGMMGMGGFPPPPPGWGMGQANELFGAYQSAMDEHRAANEARYAEGHGELSGLRDRSMDRVTSLGQQARQDINDNAARSAASRHSDLVARGLTASTAAIANDTVTNRERNNEMRRLDDMLTRQQLDVDRSTTGDLVGFVERRNDLPPDFNQLMALSQGLGQFGGSGMYPFGSQINPSLFGGSATTNMGPASMPRSGGVGGAMQQQQSAGNQYLRGGGMTNRGPGSPGTVSGASAGQWNVAPQQQAGARPPMINYGPGSPGVGGAMQQQQNPYLRGGNQMVNFGPGSPGTMGGTMGGTDLNGMYSQLLAQQYQNAMMTPEQQMQQQFGLQQQSLGNQAALQRQAVGLGLAGGARNRESSPFDIFGGAAGQVQANYAQAMQRYLAGLNQPQQAAAMPSGGGGGGGGGGAFMGAPIILGGGNGMFQQPQPMGQWALRGATMPGYSGPGNYGRGQQSAPRQSQRPENFASFVQGRRDGAQQRRQDRAAAAGNQMAPYVNQALSGFFGLPDHQAAPITAMRDLGFGIGSMNAGTNMYPNSHLDYGNSGYQTAPNLSGRFGMQPNWGMPMTYNVHANGLPSMIPRHPNGLPSLSN